MVKHLAKSPHDPLGITDSACKNHLVVVSVQYGPFYTYITTRSTTIGKSRVAIDPIIMHTSWRSNSDIASVTRQTHLSKTHPVLWPEIYHTIVSSDNIGYPRMRASGESSTTKHRLLHASGPHPISPPNDPNLSHTGVKQVIECTQLRLVYSGVAMSSPGTRLAPDLELGESKAFSPLKILTAKTIGTYISKNKNITVEEVVDEPVEKVLKKAVTKRKPDPTADEPVAKKKRTTVGRAAPADKNLAIVLVVQNPEPISVILDVSPKVQRRHAPNRKLVLQKESDDEETVEEIIEQVIAETAMLETDLEEPVVMETAGTEPVETESGIDVSAITNADEPAEIEKANVTEKEKETELVLELTEPSMSDEESLNIAQILQQIPEDMMLPSVTYEEPTKIIFGLEIEIREIEEGDWYKASLPQIDVADKRKEPLVIREKVIEEFVSFFHSFSLRRLAVLESVSDIAAKEEQMLAWAETDSLQTAVARRLYIIAKRSSHFFDKKLLKQMREHRLEWTRPCSSKLFEGANVQRADDIPPDEETPVDQISMPLAIVSSHDYTEEFAQLRATVDKISLEQVQSICHIDELKTALSKKVSSLETAFLTASDNQDKEVQDHKAAIANYLLEFRVEAQENFNTLSAHLSEIIAYINRGRDDKKGEISISRVPQPPDDQIRPSGGGSRSEPLRKRGGGSNREGGSTSSRGFRYWLGGS
ncbi:peroxisome assembly factor-2 [Dorcoceras hygrometricum]|uniref:Peroxisome assembly factor-2 n=1 Tax=Dorcoceras hygrometricum TaxID=472368 RepID=A0A2Z7AUW0_9LAMI|nr:peroxisome assembly factor-2 [Dorcoceras hygrometricum]